MTRKLILSMFCSIAMAATVCMAATPSGSADEAGAAGQDPAKAAQVESLLQKAIENAKSKKQKKVNVFLDEKKDTVQKGDYVRVRYTARLKDDTRVRLSPLATSTNRDAFIISDPKDKRANDTVESTLLAGDAAAVLGLGTHILDMNAGQTKALSLAPEKAFGARSEKNVKTKPRTQVLNQIQQVKPDAYLNRFKKFPVVGAKFPFNRYAIAEVIRVEEEKVVLKLMIEDGKTFSEPYGETVISLVPDSNQILFKLNPTLGAIYGRGGRISSVSDVSFIVDFNHPISGETIDVNLTIDEIIKPSAFGNDRIQWSDDLEAGLNLARKENKPVIVHLYADWCKWCKRMEGTTFVDPWVRFFKDKYVWVKINSHKKKEYKQKFGQQGFPLTVLMSPDAQVMRRMSGYKDGNAFRGELLEGLNRVHPSPGDTTHAGLAPEGSQLRLQ